MPGNQLARHGQRWNNVASGTAAGDEYTQTRQSNSFHEGLPSGSELSFSGTIPSRIEKTINPTIPRANMIPS
jgi:hypothetical protein